jgi:RHS repeat-associated protein
LFHLSFKKLFLDPRHDYLLKNSSVTYAEQFSYDPWGRRRNPTNWTFDNVPVPILLDRGFTGHEHLDKLGLINMNGRMYDPIIGRFLGVDPIIQMPENSQSFNGYSYCLNNPLKYTDPSGYEYDKFLRDWERDQRDDPGPDELYNNYVDYWGQIQDAFANMHTYEENEKAKKQKQEKDKKEKENRPSIIEPNSMTKALAQIFSTNYPGAAAVFIDIGGTIVGGELDGGGFLVLVGKDAGAIAFYTEDAGGLSSDLSFGPEFGMIYIDYSPDDFEATDLYGDRDKIWVGAGEVIIGSISLTRAFVEEKGWIYGTAVQGGFGGDIFISGGFNRGKISNTKNLLYYLFK